MKLAYFQRQLYRDLILWFSLLLKSRHLLHFLSYVANIAYYGAIVFISSTNPGIYRLLSS